MRIQIKEHLKNNNALFVIIETEPKEFFVVYSRLYPTSESPDDIYQVIKTEHELKPKKIKAFFEKEKENFSKESKEKEENSVSNFFEEEKEEDFKTWEIPAFLRKKQK